MNSTVIAQRDALLQRLPRVDGSIQKLTNLLYGPRSASELFAWEKTFTWRWRYHTRAIAMPEIACLTAPEGEVWVAIERDYGFCPDLTIDWRPFSGEARLLAWTLSYEPLIVHLRKLFGYSFEPTELITAREASATSGRCWLTFGVENLAGETVLSGVAAFLPRTAPAESGAHVLPPPILLPLDPIPIAVRIVVATVRIPLDELRAVSKGDVISLGKAARVRDGGNLRGESIDHRLHLGLRIEKGALRVETMDWRPFGGMSRATQFSQAKIRSGSMPPNAEDPAIHAADVDALSVTLTFEAGEIVLTVGELKALAPGATLSLGRKLTDSPITIRANGKELATGELVLVDDFLGVRITGMRNHGAE